MTEATFDSVFLLELNIFSLMLMLTQQDVSWIFSLNRLSKFRPLISKFNAVNQKVSHYLLLCSRRLHAISPIWLYFTHKSIVFQQKK